MLDVFRSDAFSVVSLTDAILKRPYKPGRIGSLGLFRERGMTTTVAVVESKNGRLSLIPVSPRGGPASTIGAERRTARSFVVPHLERESTIMADEVQNVRAFGSENAEQAVKDIVSERLTDLRAMHEVTLEFHRVGAIQGKILDADGATPIYNLFDEFGIEQQTHGIDLTDEKADIRGAAVAIQRKSESELGAEPVSGYRAFCGDEFFDAFISHPNVVESLKFQESALLRTDQRSGFEYGGITWENYRGKVPGVGGSVDFFPTDEAFVVPIGTSIFATYFAPADFMETVNTVGLPVYAKIALDAELNRWAKLHSQSNPLAMCTRPRAVIRVTISGS
jgi:hypothetical protein